MDWEKGVVAPRAAVPAPPPQLTPGDPASAVTSARAALEQCSGRPPRAAGGRKRMARACPCHCPPLLLLLLLRDA